MRYLKYFFVLLFVLLLWYLRTWFHGLVMFFYLRPVILQVLIITIVIHFFLLKRSSILSKKHSMVVDQNSKETLEFTPAFFISVVLFCLFLLPGLLFSGWFRGDYLANNINYIERSTLPESSQDLRLMPYEVAQRYAKDSLQLSQYKLGTENIALIDDNLSWIFPLVPDGLVIKFLRQNKGIAYIDANKQERNSDHLWKDMEIGEGMQIRDNLYWNVYRQRYFIKTDDTYYLTDGEEIYTVLAAIEYSFKFRMGLLYTVPEFAGVFLVDTAGNIDFLSEEEAQNHSLLANNRIFPEKLSREYIKAYEYIHGISNRLFIHEDQIQIQDVQSPGSQVNKQPYLINTEEGLKWFISTEPYGASHGVFKVFIIDAVTGEIEVFHLPEDQTLTGPVRAVDYVRRSNPVVDWNRFNSVEPIPFIREGRLYWKLAVIPSDAAGIAYQAFVAADTNEVFELYQDDDVFAFIQGEDLEELVEREEGQEDPISQIRSKLAEIEELLEDINF
ncbi:MAG: hypothetical protein ACOCRZ_08025 [Halothermotrichaceae bacterium]